MKTGTRNVILISSGAAVVALALGVIIGWYSHTPDPLPSWTSTVQMQLEDVDDSTITRFLELISTENIRSNLMFLAEQPHMATTSRDEELAAYISEQWTDYLDESELVTREFLMSFPSSAIGEENVATVYEADGSVTMTTRTSEEVYEDYMQAPDTIVPYFNAFAPAGDVEGQLVYANFGSEDDFAFLASQGINLTGTIALTKYGSVDRGTRTIYAKEYGVAGVLVYSDPENYVLEGDEGYPDDSSLPPTGVQRGLALSEFGDPSTPGYPSIKSAYRVPVDEIEVFPVLPLTPIAYEDAEKLIQRLDHDPSYVLPSDWTTGLNNNELRIGPGFTAGGYLRLSVNNELRYVESKNVIGKIKGSTEPDDWVIFGNHRDSWVYGALDPSSGTACMLEMTRALGELLKTGWRPKRTMIFGSWGAEEFGLFGSIEWAQEKAQLLSQRSVAYVNLDIAVFGNESFFAGASPLMRSLMTDAAEKVQDPVDSSKTVLDTWIEFYPDSPSPDKPYIGGLHSSSDHAYFYHALGITVADISYRGNSSNPRHQISLYPTYHTAYDTFDYVDRFVDPGFHAHTTVCKVAGSALIQAADSLIIPFDPRDMAMYVEKQINTTEANYGGYFDSENIDYLKEAGQDLTDSADTFMAYVNGELDRTNLIKIGAVNSRLRLFERNFIEPLGLAGSPNFKHISGSYYGALNGAFPSLDALLSDVDSPSEEVMKEAKKQLAMITYRLLNAASYLGIESDPY